MPLTTFLLCCSECLRPCVFLSEDSKQLSVLTEWFEAKFTLNFATGVDSTLADELSVSVCQVDLDIQGDN